MHYCFPKIYFLNIRYTVDNHFAIKKVPPCPFEEMFREISFTFSHNFEGMLTKNVILMMEAMLIITFFLLMEYGNMLFGKILQNFLNLLRFRIHLAKFYSYGF